MTKFDQVLSDRVPLPAPQSQSQDLTKPFKYCFIYKSEQWFLIKNKTFNNGSLGSGIDEERSEMR